MNNFAAIFAINAAFQCSQVFRLKATFKVSVTPCDHALYEVGVAFNRKW